MRSRLKNLVGSASVRIMIGLLVGQGLIFGSLPVITRLYSTAEVGYSGSFLAAASIVGAVATFRLETLLPSATETEARWLAKNALISLTSISIISGIGYYIVRPEHGFNAALFGLTVAGLGGVVLALQSATRTNRLNGVAISKASQGLGQVGVQVLSGLVGATRIGMQAGFALGYLGSAFVQWIALRSDRPRVRMSNLSRDRKKDLWRHSFILTIAGGFNIVAVWMYPIVIQHYFGSVAAGHLTVAQRLVIVPAGLMVAAFAPVVVASVSARIRTGQDTRPQIISILRKLVPLGLTTMLVMLFVPREWLESLLGQEWGAAKGYLAALSVAAATQVTIGPLSLILILQGRSSTQLRWDLARTLVLLSLVMGTAELTDDPLTTVWVGSATMTVFYLLYLSLILRPPSHLSSLDQVGPRNDSDQSLRPRVPPTTGLG